MSPEIRRLIKAIRDAVDYMDIDDACNELEALLASQLPPTEKQPSNFYTPVEILQAGRNTDPPPADPQPEDA